MSVQHQEFRGRVARLQSKHAGFSQGYAARVQSDGLILIEPRKIRSRISGKIFVLIIGAFLLFKAFLMAALGYPARIIHDSPRRLKNLFGFFTYVGAGFGTAVAVVIAAPVWQRKLRRSAIDFSRSQNSNTAHHRLCLASRSDCSRANHVHCSRRLD